MTVCETGDWELGIRPRLGHLLPDIGQIENTTGVHPVGRLLI